MADYFEFGRQLSQFLQGFSAGQASGEAQQVAASRPGQIEWGRRISTDGLEQLYGPREVPRFTTPTAGIDNLALSANDVFVRPGIGEFSVAFDGYFQVARAKPTTSDWETAEVHVNLTDMRLTGEDSSLGPINVTLNPAVVSGGQTFAPGATRSVAKCRIAAAVQFSAPEAGVTLFNKEPVLLMNDGIDSIPPVEDPNGKAFIYLLPLYDVKAPQAPPVAYLKELRYTVGDYLPLERADEIRDRIPAAVG